MVGTIRSMTICGCIYHTIGDVYEAGIESRQSSIKITEKLEAIIKESGLTRNDILEDFSQRPLLTLKGEKVGKKAPYLDIDDADPLVARLKNEMALINDYIRSYDITLDIPAKRFIEHGLHENAFNWTKAAPHLTRKFNQSSWKSDGRLYGAWWQNVPKWTREYMAIEGSPAAFLDYANFGIRAIYHKLGLDPVGDLYDIPKAKRLLALEGFNPAEARDAIKIQLNALINTMGANPRIERSVEQVDGRSVLISVTARKIIRAIRQAIVDFHKPISSYFRAGKGSSIPYWESNVTVGIMLAAAKDGIPVVPFHDAIITTEKFVGLTKELMVDSYYKEFGFQPVIS